MKICTSSDFARVFRSLFCSVLLLTRHGLVEANTWANGKRPRSSTLAMMSPGGRNRPNYDMKAIRREAEEKIAKIEAEKERAKAEGNLKSEGKTGEGGTDVEATPVEPGAAVTPPTQLETGTLVPASSDIFEMEKGSPLSLAIFFGKAAMVAGVGFYGARKVVAFAKAAMKRRQAAGVETSVAVTNEDEDDDEDENKEEMGDEVQETDGDTAQETQANDDVQDEQDEHGDEQGDETWTDLATNDDVKGEETRQELVAGDGRKAGRKDHQQNVRSEEEFMTPSGTEEELLLSKGFTREKPSVSSGSTGVALVNPWGSEVDISYV